jgi:hypothetical protein
MQRLVRRPNRAVFWVCGTQGHTVYRDPNIRGDELESGRESVQSDIGGLLGLIEQGHGPDL